MAIAGIASRAAGTPSQNGNATVLPYAVIRHFV